MSGFFINTPIVQRSASYYLWIKDWILEMKKKRIVILVFDYVCLFVY